MHETDMAILSSHFRSGQGGIYFIRDFAVLFSLCITLRSHVRPLTQKIHFITHITHHMPEKSPIPSMDVPTRRGRNGATLLVLYLVLAAGKSTSRI